MTDAPHIFMFDPGVPMEEVEDTLALSRMAAEALHGPERVALGVRSKVDRCHRRVVIETTTEAGTEMSIIFLGYVRREFGHDAVRVGFAAATRGQS